MSIPTIIMSVFSYAFSFKGTAANWTSIIILAVTIFFIQKHYLKNYYNGFASYAKLFTGTLLMTCVSAIIVSCFTFIFYTLIAPEQIEQMLQLAKNNLYENNIPDDQIEIAFEYSKMFMTPIALSLFALLGNVLQATIINLITSAINQKKGNGFNEAMKNISEEE